MPWCLLRLLHEARGEQVVVLPRAGNVYDVSSQPVKVDKMLEAQGLRVDWSTYPCNASQVKGLEYRSENNKDNSGVIPDQEFLDLITRLRKRFVGVKMESVGRGHRNSCMNIDIVE